MALSVGTQAPDAEVIIKDDEGVRPIKLSHWIGIEKQVVLLFFPAAFTGVCTQEMCDVTAGLGQYDLQDAKVLAISTDTPFAQEAWAEKHGIKVTLLSDFNKEAVTAYDVAFESLVGLKTIAKRAAFVINATGDIIFASSSDNPKELPDFEAIQKVLKGEA